MLDATSPPHASAREQRDARAQTLAAGGEHALHGLGDQRVVGGEARRERTLRPARTVRRRSPRAVRPRSCFDARRARRSRRPSAARNARPVKPARVKRSRSSSASGWFVQRVRQIRVGALASRRRFRRPAARCRRNKDRRARLKSAFGALLHVEVHESRAGLEARGASSRSVPSMSTTLRSEKPIVAPSNVVVGERQRHHVAFDELDAAARSSRGARVRGRPRASARRNRRR